MNIILLFLILFGVILFLYMLREAFLNRVEEHKFHFADFPKSFGTVSIFFISDIHRRTISDSIIDRVKGRADVVIIGGDLAEKGVPIKRVKANLCKLKHIAPVYFVWGNNDYEINHNKLIKMMEELQIKVLNNTASTFNSEKGEKWCLLGVDDLGQERDRLDLALKAADDQGFKILISHYPDITEKILPEHDIRLVLSGHTHGGQIHFLGYSPQKRGGVKQLANTTILISNGYGTTALPLRLGAPAECHLISVSR
ncbi:metallophosphoesterase [Neobacillus kokaensis]|uniref:Metallophosphoesterase n=1 Tax=Neobacillus kokaensis TaxID=2759023 RepID=A0ABQ3N2E0_9BACI|nr:metallophosphoesterase [Neobacillus kokaensis]GHH98158.1 metallophosphoesterase [Neobacillus kokaensis]